MIIQAFINDWDSPRAHPHTLADSLKPYCQTVLLDSYDQPFSIQWDEAVSRFTGDIFLWAMADARVLYNREGTMIDTMRRVYERWDIAMYAPNLDWTAVTYNTSKLKPIMPGIYEVPATDLIFASMTRELLELLPPLDGNLHAWSYDYLAAYIALAKLGKMAVRDYNIKIEHPKAKMYSETEANDQQIAWLKSLPEEYQHGVRMMKQLQETSHA